MLASLSFWQPSPFLMRQVDRVGTGGDPAACSLRQLHWNKGDTGAGKTKVYRLGNGESGTTAWASADTRYLLLSEVALGRCKDYDTAEPNIKGGTLLRPPDGFHSVQARYSW